MGATEQRKALERVSDAMRRLLAGTKALARPPEEIEAPALPPGPPPSRPRPPGRPATPPG